MTASAWTVLQDLALETPRKGDVIVTGDGARWRVTALRDGAFRLRLEIDGVDCPGVSHALAEPVCGSDDGHTSTTTRVSDDTFAIADDHGELITLLAGGTRWSGTRREISIAYKGGERTFGLGEKSGKLDKRGSVLEFWNTDAYLYDRLTDPLYKSIPFWIGVRDDRAYGVLVDNPGRVKIDFGAWDTDQIRVRVETGAIDLYVIPGPHPIDVLRGYTNLTGRPAMPPRWALGFHQCRYSYRPASRVEDVALRFRELDIPCDGIWLDIHYMHGYRCFTWDPIGFPDPLGLVDGLHDQGYHVVAMIDPGLKVEDGYHAYTKGKEADVFVRTPDGQEGHGTCWPGPCAYPDFFRDDVREWWGPLYTKLTDVGVDGFWNDMNEPSVFDGPDGTFPDDAVHQRPDGDVSHREVHNAYGHEMVRATHDGLAALRPDRRPFVLTRAAFAGTQRYAAAWSGDNSSTWDDLRTSVPMALNMAACGFPLYGPDIGGFGGSPSPELFVRWLQSSAYMGLMRVHTHLGTPDQEPWSFGEPWTSHAREAIRGRYRLIAYLYSLLHESAASGRPVVQPFWMRWPKAPHLHQRDDAWMLGDNLMVAPVLEPGVDRRKLSLPPGRWFTFPAGRPLRVDGQAATVDAPLDRPPLFARGGAIIPWQDPAPHTGAQDASVLRVKVFAGDDGAFTLVEDAGDGPADGGVAEDGACRRTTVRLRSEPLHQIVTVEVPEGSFASGAQAFDIELHGLPGPPDQVFRNGDPESARIEPATEGDGTGWCWNDTARSARILVPIGEAATTIEVSHPPLPTSDNRPTLVARAAVDDDGDWPRGGGLHLAGWRHVGDPGAWKSRDLDVRVAARWTPAALQMVCSVEDPGFDGALNDQEDGLRLILQVPGQVFELRVAPPGPDAGAWLREDRHWARHDEIRVDVTRDGDVTAYRFEVPAKVLGAPELVAGLECPCDLAVQHSRADGTRGVVEWVRGHTAPEEPGGRLRLL